MPPHAETATVTLTGGGKSQSVTLKTGQTRAFLWTTLRGKPHPAPWWM